MPSIEISSINVSTWLSAGGDCRAASSCGEPRNMVAPFVEVSGVPNGPLRTVMALSAKKQVFRAKTLQIPARFMPL